MLLRLKLQLLKVNLPWPICMVLQKIPVSKSWEHWNSDWLNSAIPEGEKKNKNPLTFPGSRIVLWKNTWGFFKGFTCLFDMPCQVSPAADFSCVTSSCSYSLLRNTGLEEVRRDRAVFLHRHQLPHTLSSLSAWGLGGVQLSCRPASPKGWWALLHWARDHLHHICNDRCHPHHILNQATGCRDPFSVR